MAEPLKAMYNPPFLRQFADLVRSAWPSFDGERFVRLALGEGWDGLELKGRIRRIAESLGAVLPADYAEALNILYRIDERCVGFSYLFFPDYVEVFGRNEWELSMDALERFTVRSSAEFAIRPFLLAETDRTMAKMREWAEHDNEHVRRLSSEGCRPRLPWGQALAMFKRDPSPILPVLERLRRDDSLYVRKSVANNLNDIAKDHPDIVRGIAARWAAEGHPHTSWIVRHGCRTLLRAADPATLALFGYEGEGAGTAVAGAALHADRPEAAIGGSTELTYEFALRDGEPLRLRVELGVDYVKANGRLSQKRFLLSDKTFEGTKQVKGSRRLDWKELTTRKHYPGVHRLHLLVNGEAVAETSVLLHADANGRSGGGDT